LWLTGARPHWGNLRATEHEAEVSHSRAEGAGVFVLPFPWVIACGLSPAFLAFCKRGQNRFQRPEKSSGREMQVLVAGKQASRL